MCYPALTEAHVACPWFFCQASSHWSLTCLNLHAAADSAGAHDCPGALVEGYVQQLQARSVGSRLRRCFRMLVDGCSCCCSDQLQCRLGGQPETPCI